MSTPSLKGLRILNPRPTVPGKELSSAIEEAGGQSINCPALEIQPTSSEWMLDLPPLESVDMAIFISISSVRCALKEIKDSGLSWPSSIYTIAIGSKTAMELERAQIHVDETPESADSEHVIKLSSLRNLFNKTILLFKGVGGRKLIENTLKKREANLTVLEVYQRKLPDFNKNRVNSIWHEDKVDIILFTSKEIIDNVFKMFGKEAYEWICSKPCIVLSQRLAQYAQHKGMQYIIISQPDNIIKCIHNVHQGLIHGKEQ